MIFPACDRSKNITDAGESSILKNNETWDNEIVSSSSTNFPDEIFISFSNAQTKFNPPHGKIRVSNLHIEEGEQFIKAYDSSNPLEISSVYQNRTPGDPTPQAEWDLVEDYKELAFELTYVSKNKRNVEGFLNLAYAPRQASTPSFFGEPDTVIFKGTFEARVPK